MNFARSICSSTYLACIWMYKNVVDRYHLNCLGHANQSNPNMISIVCLLLCAYYFVDADLFHYFWYILYKLWLEGICSYCSQKVHIWPLLRNKDAQNNLEFQLDWGNCCCYNHGQAYVDFMFIMADTEFAPGISL